MEDKGHPVKRANFNLGEEKVKSRKLRFGEAYTYGRNDFGQLGHDAESPSTSLYPMRIPDGIKITQVACGDQHTLALDTEGQIWSCGRNVDGALGRPTVTVEDESTPARVTRVTNAVMICAGECHSAALTRDGEVLIWGAWNIGGRKFGVDSHIPEEDEAGRCQYPWPITSNLTNEKSQKVIIVKIKSGANHVAMLGVDSRLYTFGDSSFGQLGRAFEKKPRTRSCDDIDEETPTEFYRNPHHVIIGNKYCVNEIWTTRDGTICSAGRTKSIYVMGRNENSQLGIDGYAQAQIFRPTQKTSFNSVDIGDAEWVDIAGCHKRTTALTSDGRVFEVGRYTDLFAPGCPQVVHRLIPISTLTGMISGSLSENNSVTVASSRDKELLSWYSSGTIRTRKIALEPGFEDKEVDIIGVSVGEGHVAVLVESCAANEPKPPEAGETEEQDQVRSGM